MTVMRALAVILWFAGLAASGFAQQAYKSPYSVRFTFSPADLVGDLEGSRGDIKNQSSVKFQSWYADTTKTRYGVWGPPSQHFDPPAGLSKRDAEWMRQRVIAVGLRYQGYRYQHHHIPDWDPPADWPYKQSPLGKQSKGLDCSNYTAFVYNLALGLKPSGATKEQAEMKEVPGPGEGRTTKVTRIEKPESHEDFERALKTGDLLFINRQNTNEVSHVVLWVGRIGQSRNDVPLILDSTGEGRKDEEGNDIPDGVHLRPFTTNSWYFRSASHALRLIPDGK
jgi:cell wall-associated NlpC family hydrolase